MSTEKLEAAYAELETEARKLAELVSGLPHWLHDADVHVPYVQPTLDALEALRVLRQPEAPSSLANAPWWLLGHYPKAWLVRLGEGPAAAITDGHSLLVIDELPDAPKHSSRWSPEEALRSVSCILKSTDALIRHVISIEELERWCDAAVEGYGKKHGAIGPCALDSERVRDWVLRVARVTGALSASIAVDPTEAHAGVLFEGTGWRAVVMPVRHSAEGLPQLLEIGGAA